MLSFDTRAAPDWETPSVPRASGVLLVSHVPVQAVVLTYNARDALERCLDAIAAQSVRPASILVIDNASEPPVDDVVAGHDEARLLRLERNLGPAGGYARGLEEFVASRFAWAWLMDDDSVPAPDALEQLLAGADPRQVQLSAMVDRATRQRDDTHGWCGVLIPRNVVERAGVPRGDFFWWAEDTEYLQWRIPSAGFETVRCERAIVEVSRTRADDSKPSWKYYYEARNQVYFRLYVQHQIADHPFPHLRPRVRAGRAARAVLTLGVRAVLREGSDRHTKVWMVCRGALDGLRGRLGQQVVPEDPDRPMTGPLEPFDSGAAGSVEVAGGCH